MRILRLFGGLIAILLLISMSACQGDSTLQSEEPAGDAPVAEYEPFDPENFSHSTQVDNNWFPLKAGTQFVYEGETMEDGESVPHRIVITITDLTKVIGGVRSVVSWDRDYSQDELVEAELAFFAQDDDGNVWRMGEYPEEYENGEFVVAPTWIHGFQDARAGIAMQADPKTGTPSYSQGWGPAVDWTDRGQVDAMGQKLCVPVDCYQDVLVISETSRSEAGAFQLKYYASGLGNIRTDWKGTDQTQETLDLIEVIQLNPEDLAKARTEALKLEMHAFQVSTDMYVHTQPAEYPEGTPAIDVELAPSEAVEPTQSDASGSVDGLAEIVVYASDLPKNALYEMEFWDDPASPGGKLIGIPNNGDELDPPPENDPHVKFEVQVQNGVPYRCWIHMKVGEPMGVSQANVVWVQFSGAVDQANQDVFKPGSNSYLTAQGPTQTGWAWVGCDLEGSDSLIYFKANGKIAVRVQAGMEGVGFDQFLLSSSLFLETSPSVAVVER